MPKNNEKLIQRTITGGSVLGRTGKRKVVAGAPRGKLPSLNNPGKAVQAVVPGSTNVKGVVGRLQRRTRCHHGRF